MFFSGLNGSGCGSTGQGCHLSRRTVPRVGFQAMLWPGQAVVSSAHILGVTRNRYRRREAASGRSRRKRTKNTSGPIVVWCAQHSDCAAVSPRRENRSKDLALGPSATLPELTQPIGGHRHGRNSRPPQAAGLERSSRLRCDHPARVAGCAAILRRSMVRRPRLASPTE